MKQHRSRSGLGRAASVTTVIGIATGLALAAPLASHAAEVPLAFTLDFSDLQADVPSSQDFTLDVPRAGELDAFTWVDRTGILETASIEFEVCDDNGKCVPMESLPQPVAVAAGPQPVRVTVTVAEQGSGTAIGRLTLASSDEPSLIPGGSTSGLATTGSIASTIVPWAVAVLALGTLAVMWPRAIVAAKRRRTDNEEGTQ